MALRTKTLNRLVERVLRFVRLILSITWTQNTGPAIVIRTAEMLLPRSLKEKTISYVLFVLGHEVGHLTAFPRTEHWDRYYEMLATKLGYVDPGNFVNVIADLFDNNWNLTRTPWKVVFAKECRSFYTPGQGHDARWEFLSLMMRTRVTELALPRSTDAAAREAHLDGLVVEGIYKAAYRLLFWDPRPVRRRYEDLAELLKEKLQGERCNNPKVKAHGGASAENLPALDPVQSPEEFQDWMDAVKGIGPKATMEYLQKQHVRSRSLFDVAQIVAFSELIKAEDAGGATHLVTDGPAERRIWKPTDSPLELRLGETVRRNGVVLPGITTLRRENGTRREENARGRGTLTLVIDTSGSMKNDLAAVLIVGWAAVMAAKRRGDRVAILEFASEPSYLVPPGRDFVKAKEVLESLQAGGGTCIVPALDETIKVSKELRRKPTLLILTDTDVAEGDQAVLDRLQKVLAMGGKSIVCVPDEHDVKRWVSAGRAQGLLDAFVIKDLTNVRGAVKALV